MSAFGYKKETFSGLPEDPNNAPASSEQSQPQAPQQLGFFTRIVIHVIGAVAGGLTIIFGLFICISLSGMCILAGLYLMILGFGLIVMEAPICFKCWEPTDKVGEWSQSLSPLIKAALYLLLPIATFFMCIGPSQVIACFLVMAVGALYGIVFVGKKGDGVKLARQQHLTMSEMESQEKPGAYSQGMDP